MTNIDLDALDLKELKKLRTNVNNAIENFEERKRQDALVALEAKAREMGFSLSELTSSGSKKSKAVSPPKYRHPENPSLTWSGRGRQPGWIKDAVANGQSMDDFLIKG
ncbi:H-NS histone family protein [Brevirhabdus sp.]|uniref:H-NS histone family protein n=1 Tax=Brevirhabdus sp. TaxID=2004514 RepID=UPI0040587D47